jgi:curved DNA-binding protein CbpA
MTTFTAEGSGFSFSVFAPPQPVAPEVYRSAEGIGYPSCSRALAKIPPNTNDANGYYETIGVEPWADEKTIKSAIRKLLAKFHPDGVAPDRDMFERIKEIASVLLNPITRANYNSIAQGRKLIDSQVMREMEERGIGEDDPGIDRFDRTAEDMDGKDVDKRGNRKRMMMYDYLAVDHNELDLINANEWYGYFLQVAPMFQYEGIIAVLMHDGKSSAFKKMGSIMLVPRSWEPNIGRAFDMFYRHIGWPKLKPRHAEQPFTVSHSTYSPGRYTGTGINGGGGLLLSPATSSAFRTDMSDPSDSV